MGLIDSIVGAESGGNPNATNPNSSASGLGQFINSTWVSTLRQHRPDIASGKSDADLIALKADPQLSREMTGAYADDNGKILQGAGVPVTPGSTYLAHFAGPQGAVSVLKADPNTPISEVLTPGAVKANPFLQGMTAGDLQAWADRKMGGKQAAPVAPSAPAAPATAPQPTQAIPQQSAPIFAPPPAQSQPAPQGQQMQANQAPMQTLATPQVASPTSIFGQMPAEMNQPPPIFAPQRKPIDLSKLKAALGNRGFFNGMT